MGRADARPSEMRGCLQIAARLRSRARPLIARYFLCLAKRRRGRRPAGGHHRPLLCLRRRHRRRLMSVRASANELAVHIFVAIRVDPFTVLDRPPQRQWHSGSDFQQRLAPRSFALLRRDFSVTSPCPGFRRRAFGGRCGCGTRRRLHGDGKGCACNE